MIGTFSALWEKTHSGYPYETWDEIGTFNDSWTVLVPSSVRVFSYGSLDTAQQLVANFAYKNFDLVGRDVPLVSYCNNIIRSLSETNLAFGRNTWGGGEYNYFRGLNDHQAIFLSRKIHLLVTLALMGLLGTLLMSEFRMEGAITAIAFISFLFCEDFSPQILLSLPNAQATLTLACMMTCSAIALRKTSTRFLTFALIAQAAAVNLKLDTAILGMFVGFTTLSVAWKTQTNKRDILRFSLKSTLLFIAAVFAFKPTLFWRMSGEIAIQRHEMAGLSLKPDVSKNFHTLLDFLNHNMPLFHNLNGYSGLLLLSAIAIFVFLACRNFERNELIILLGGGVFHILFITLRSRTLYPRYFLYGWGLIYLAFVWALAIIFVNSHRRTSKILSIACICATLLISGNGLSKAWNESVNIQKESIGNERLDPANSRNQLTVKALALLKTGKYSSNIFIDQHSYFDLRSFLVAGYQPIYINILNYRDQFTSLDEEDRKKAHLVLVVPGKGDWPSKLAKKYELYLADLQALPVLGKTGTDEPFDLMDIKPVPNNNSALILLKCGQATSSAQNIPTSL